MYLKRTYPTATLHVRKFRNSRILLFLMLFLCIRAGAQKLRVSPVDLAHELPSLSVTKTFQDKEGVMWFGTTEGLCRYDAYGVVTFNLQNITSIGETNGYILVGTEAGLFAIHKHTYKVAPFPDKRLTNQKINDLLIDGQQQVWVGTSKGIHVYRADFTVYRSYGPWLQHQLDMPDAGINSFFEDRSGIIWIGYREGGLLALNPKTEETTRYPKIGSRDNPYSILQDEGFFLFAYAVYFLLTGGLLYLIAGKPSERKVPEARIPGFTVNKRAKQLDFKTNPQINISALEQTPLDEQFLNKMIQIVEAHLSDTQFDVLVLGDKLALSKSTLYRKTKALLNLSPSEFIKNIRLKHACQMMEKDAALSVSQIAFATGFSDPRYFATCFKAEFGITPSEYQKQQENRLTYPPAAPASTKNKC